MPGFFGSRFWRRRHSHERLEALKTLDLRKPANVCAPKCAPSEKGDAFWSPPKHKTSITVHRLESVRWGAPTKLARRKFLVPVAASSSTEARQLHKTANLPQGERNLMSSALLQSRTLFFWAASLISDVRPSRLNDRKCRDRTFAEQDLKRPLGRTNLPFD